jgi:hypothetical protein
MHVLSAYYDYFRILVTTHKFKDQFNFLCLLFDNSLHVHVSQNFMVQEILIKFVLSTIVLFIWALDNYQIELIY